MLRFVVPHRMSNILLYEYNYCVLPDLLLAHSVSSFKSL